MSSIPPELIQSYLPISKQLFDGCSNSLFIGIADNGNHFLEHGIREGTKLVFDQEKPFQKGQLSCFIDPANKLHLPATKTWKLFFQNYNRLMITPKGMKAMASIKCKMCGGTIEVYNESVAVCEFCGSTQTVPQSKNAYEAKQFQSTNAQDNPTGTPEKNPTHDIASNQMIEAVANAKEQAKSAEDKFDFAAEMINIKSSSRIDLSGAFADCSDIDRVQFLRPCLHNARRQSPC